MNAGSKIYIEYVFYYIQKQGEYDEEKMDNSSDVNTIGESG